MTEQVRDNAYTIDASRNLKVWLNENRCTIAFSTYQHGALFLIGLDQSGKLTQSVHRFARCMGFHADARKIWVSSVHQLWRFGNEAGDLARAQGVDRVYRPRVSFITGDIDIHEMTEDASGRLVFVNTLFSCLATHSVEQSFEPVWKPPFISKLAAEDRCHLNGLASRDGQSAYVSALAASDVVSGWRDHRLDGGVLIDVASGEFVARGLCMPHSPRWALGRLWVLNSGQGSFGTVDLSDGKFTEVTFCPGYARGMRIIGKHAVIGLSRPRSKGAFGGLPLAARLEKHRIEARCGVIVVDLETGNIVEWMFISGSISEIFDVGVLEGTRRAVMLADPKQAPSQLLSFRETTGS